MKDHRHFILYKPVRVLSQFVNNQKKRKNKKLLGDIFDFPEGTMSIGRLDEDSEGLLLLTTDGKVSEYIRSRKVEKEYYVEVDGLITDKALSLLRQPVDIKIHNKEYTTLPSKKVERIQQPSFISMEGVRERHRPTSWVAITISEGKFRQVRKMTAAVGFPTLRLVRVRIGEIHIGDMKAGDVIEVTTLNT